MSPGGTNTRGSPYKQSKRGGGPLQPAKLRSALGIKHKFARNQKLIRLKQVGGLPKSHGQMRLKNQK
jgi:hypothetical protein